MAKVRVRATSKETSSIARKVPTSVVNDVESPLTESTTLSGAALR
jgi:hypothetical protein